jgi:hypothetical protein
MLAEMKSLEKENKIPAESLIEDSEYIEESQQELVVAEKKIRKVDPKPAPPVISPIKSEKIGNVSTDKLADMSANTVSIPDLADHRVVVEERSAKQNDAKQKINPSVMKQAVSSRENNSLEEDEALIGYGTQEQTSMADGISGSKESTRVQSSFGEKEFQNWCKQKAGKNMCDAGKGASVKVSFFIDETGKPANFDFLNYSCEEAKKEIANLLSSSPVWTKTTRKVTITIKW